MDICTERLHFRTAGDGQVVDITPQVASAVAGSGMRTGVVTLFVVGSTAAVTTLEFEPGLAEHDIPDLFERLAPRERYYHHHQSWGDDNGHSHVRAALLGPSLAVPFVDGALTLGRWQQIVLVDFDTRPRNRTVVAQIIGN